MLLHLECIGKRFAGFNAVKTKARHPVHFVGQDHAVPVQRRFFPKVIFDVDRHLVTFTPNQSRRGQHIVNRFCDLWLAGKIHNGFTDLKEKLCAGEFARAFHWRNTLTALGDSGE